MKSGDFASSSAAIAGDRLDPPLHVVIVIAVSDSAVKALDLVHPPQDFGFDHAGFQHRTGDAAALLPRPGTIFSVDIFPSSDRNPSLASPRSGPPACGRRAIAVQPVVLSVDAYRGLIGMQDR